MGDVVQLLPPAPFEPQFTMERERDKLLHVAELLEADRVWHKVEWHEALCPHCERVYAMTRKFNAMALRIRRFWGWAVRPVTDVELSEMIANNLKVLNWRKKGAIPILCDPQRDIAVARELELLRIENSELRQRLAAPL